jgi:hypothetical protein
MSSNIRKAKNEDLAEFHLAVFSRARQLQHERTGLLSNENAIRAATWEYFMGGVAAIKNSIAHMKLFGGDAAEEQVSSMLEYAAKQDLSVTTVMQKLAGIEEKPALDKAQKQIDGYFTEEEDFTSSLSGTLTKRASNTKEEGGDNNQS